MTVSTWNKEGGEGEREVCGGAGASDCSQGTQARTFQLFMALLVFMCQHRQA